MHPFAAPWPINMDAGLANTINRRVGYFLLLAQTDLHARCSRMAMSISTRIRSVACFKIIRVASPRPQARSLSPAVALILACLRTSRATPCRE